MDVLDQVAIRPDMQLCSLCRLLPFFTPKAGNAEWDLGMLSSIQKEALFCAFCSFVKQTVDSFAPGILAHDQEIEDCIKFRLTEINERSTIPWYTFAGVDVAFPSSEAEDTRPLVGPAYWLRLGRKQASGWLIGRERILISPLPSSHYGEDGIILKRNKLAPRRRSRTEVEKGCFQYELIRDWMDICQTSHGKDCGHITYFKRQCINIKLIDVHQRQVIQAENNMPYLALSYVYGASSGRNVLSDISRTCPQRYPLLPEALPRTVEDAIIFTGKLGYHYLWVDMYCINHADPMELQAQISSMDLIYECAEMTIVASDGHDSEAGLAGVSRPIQCTGQPIFDAPSGRYMATFVDDAFDPERCAPWALRGWTFQEGLLSRRCLFFDRYHVRMRCRKELFHDLLNPDQRRDRFSTHQCSKYLVDDVCSVYIHGSAFDIAILDAFVSNYSRRQLTLQTDALDACKGVLNRITQNTGVGFLWGIPLVHTLEALAWNAFPEGTLARRAEFPSWTWLGWQGRTGFWDWVVKAETFLEEGRNLHQQLKSRRSQTSDQNWAREFIAQNRNAFIATKSLKEDTEGRLLRVSSMIACFGLQIVRKQSDCVTSSESMSDSVEYTGADYWTLIDKDGCCLRNLIGDNMLFIEETDYFFRTDPSISRLLIEVGSEAEFLFLQYWPAVRDSPPAETWLFDMVVVLLIVRNEDQTAWRAATVMIQLDDWIAASPKPAVVVLS